MTLQTATRKGIHDLADEIQRQWYYNGLREVGMYLFPLTHFVRHTKMAEA